MMNAQKNYIQTWWLEGEDYEKDFVVRLQKQIANVTRRLIFGRENRGRSVLLSLAEAKRYCGMTMSSAPALSRATLGGSRGIQQAKFLIDRGLKFVGCSNDTSMLFDRASEIVRGLS
jgi:hypothetical protein